MVLLFVLGSVRINWYYWEAILCKTDKGKERDLGRNISRGAPHYVKLPCLHLIGSQMQVIKANMRPGCQVYPEIKKKPLIGGRVRGFNIVKTWNAHQLVNYFELCLIWFCLLMKASCNLLLHLFNSRKSVCVSPIAATYCCDWWWLFLKLPKGRHQWTKYSSTRSEELWPLIEIIFIPNTSSRWNK